MIRSEVGDPRGILHADPDARGVEHLRLAPAPALTPFIAHFWIIRWDRQGLPPLRPETLPHPSVHMVIEGRRRAEILGVMTGKFSRTLRAQGRVFGIKFRPAAFRPFLGAPLARITNRALPIADRFGAA